MPVDKDCGLVDWDYINGIDDEAGGCIGTDGKGFNVELCKGCEFYPVEETCQ